MSRLSITPIALLLATALTACGGPEFTAGGRELPVPEDAGLYALTGSGELRRIDGSAAWERETWARRSDLDPGVEFIVFEPGIGGADGGAAPARLWRIAWVRSDILPTGAAAPAKGSEWVLAGLDAQAEPVTATWHPEIRGLFHLAPSRPLAPGLYELGLTGGTGARARVGVAWSSVDKRDYAAANCVDRIVGEPVSFRPCGAAGAGAGMVQQARAMAPQPIGAPAQPQPASAPPPLRITLDDPVRENDGLRIQGSVVNNSAKAQRIPMLQGTILHASGTPADRWFFEAPEPSIGPGQQVRFTSWRRTPPGAARLDVDFVAQ